MISVILQLRGNYRFFILISYLICYDALVVYTDKDGLILTKLKIFASIHGFVEDLLTVKVEEYFEMQFQSKLLNESQCYTTTCPENKPGQSTLLKSVLADS